MLLGILVKDHAIGFKQLLFRFFTCSKKGKTVSKGILLYHDFYKPHHIYNLSPHEQEIVDTVVRTLSQSPSNEILLQDLLNHNSIPLSSLPDYRQVLQQLSPECGVSLRREEEKVFVCYDAPLSASGCSVIRRYQAQKQQVPSSDEEDETSKTPVQSHRIFQRDHYYTVSSFLITAMKKSPKEGVSLAQLAAITGMSIKRLTTKLKQLENSGRVQIQMKNEGRSFIKYYVLRESVVLSGASRSDLHQAVAVTQLKEGRMESVEAVSRRKLVMDLVGGGKTCHA